MTKQPDTPQHENQKRKPSARERSRTDTRKRLMDAWREIIIEQGAQVATINQITDKAEVAVGTFYCHFKDKESITQEVMLDCYSTLVSELDTLEIQNTGNWKAWVCSTIETVILFAERHPREFMFLLRLVPHTSSEGLNFAEIWYVFWCQQAEDLLRRELDAGKIILDAEPALAARALVNMVNSLLEWWLEDMNRASREDMTRTLTSLLMAFYRDSE